MKSKNEEGSEVNNAEVQGGLLCMPQSKSTAKQ